MTYHFYQIRSQSALPAPSGAAKLSLVCEEDPQLHLFIWLEAENQPSHMQFLFGEQVIEWRQGHAPQAFATNRQGLTSESLGRFKGVRSLQPEEDSSALAAGLAILRQGVFPAPFGDWVAQNLLS